MSSVQPDPLDMLDDLIRHLRPLEQLFRLLGEVGFDSDGAELAHGCSAVGLALTARFREHLERSLGQDGKTGEES